MSQLDVDQIQRYFENLPQKEQIKLTRACMWYSHHVDGYLNTLYRRKLYPRAQLLTHAETLATDSTHNIWRGLNAHRGITNEHCGGTKNGLYSPFKNFINVNPLKFSLVIRQIQKLTQWVHSVFTTPGNAYILPSEIVVYRGIAIPEDAMPRMELDGLTSFTQSYEVAVDFAHTELYMVMPGARMAYTPYIIEVHLPAGTRVIPMGICSAYDEDELLLLSQGWLEPIGPTQTNNLLTLITANFIETQPTPIYNKFEVTKTYYNTVIDDCE